VHFVPLFELEEEGLEREEMEGRGRRAGNVGKKKILGKRSGRVNDEDEG